MRAKDAGATTPPLIDSNTLVLLVLGAGILVASALTTRRLAAHRG